MKSKWDCLNAGGAWNNEVYTFDDVPNAVITLFVISTTAGWQDVLLNSISSTEIDYMPDESSRSIAWTCFFIVFMVIGFFFFLNLFIGVVVATFNEQ